MKICFSIELEGKTSMVEGESSRTNLICYIIKLFSSSVNHEILKLLSCLIWDKFHCLHSKHKYENDNLVNKLLCFTDKVKTSRDHIHNRMIPHFITFRPSMSMEK